MASSNRSSFRRLSASAAVSMGWFGRSIVGSILPAATPSAHGGCPPFFGEVHPYLSAASGSQCLVRAVIEELEQLQDTGRLPRLNDRERRRAAPAEAGAAA